MNRILPIVIIFIWVAFACSIGSHSTKKLSFKNYDHPEKNYNITARLERGDHLSLKIDGKPVIDAYLDFSSTPPVNFGAGLFKEKAVVVECSRNSLPDISKDTTCNVSINGDYVGKLSFSLMSWE